MPPIEIHSSQFGLVSGIHQSVSDMVLIAEPAALFAPEARKGRLYIVAEASHDVARGRDACQLVTRTIRKAFYEDSSYSVTSSLRKAISAANKALYQHNFNAVPQKRAIVGVSCAVVKDRDLYLAQVLPAQSFLLSEGKLRALPPNPSWSSGQEGVTALIKPNALGSSLTVEPDFYRAVMRPGDSLLACSSNLARMLGRDDVMQLLRLPDSDDMMEQVLELCKRNALAEAHGLAIHARPPLSPAARTTPLSRAGVSERGRLLIRSIGDQIGRLTGEAVLMVRPGLRDRQRKAELRHSHAQRESTWLETLPEEPPPLPPAIPPTPPLDMGEALETRVEHDRKLRLGHLQPRPTNEELPPSAFLGEGDYIQTASTERRNERIDLSDTPGMPLRNRSAGRAPQQNLPIDLTLGERLTRPFEQASAAISNIGRRRQRRRLPPSAMPQVRRRPGLSYRREGPPFPWLTLLLMIVLVALFVVYGKSLSDQNTRSEASKLLDQAEVAVAQVRDAQDDASAQQKLDAAAESVALVRASSIITATEENRERVTVLLRNYERALAAVQKVTYFDDLTEIGRHPQADAGSSFSSLIVPPPPTGITNTMGFNAIYALDTNNGVLYRMPKSGGALEPFLRPDESCIETAPAGKVKAVAWRIDNVVAITQNDNGQFSYCFRNNDRWSGSNLNGSEEWSRVSNTRLRVVTYEGNLYILGPAPGQVLKYFSGRTSDPYDPWIKEYRDSKTEAASDLAVDGSIYLLQPDGRVQIFAANTFDRELPAPTIKPPLVVATSFAITGGPGSGSIFLVETEKERIIQIDKQTGALIQQIGVRADGTMRLNQLTALYVDESGPRTVIYLVNGGQILRASLPSPPRSFRETGTPAPEPTAAPAAAP